VPCSSEQGFSAGSQTRDLVTVLVLRLALPGDMGAHGDNRRTAGPLLHHPLRCPQGPSDVPAPFDFPLAGAPGDLPAVGEAVSDQAKALAKSMFDRDQEVGHAALGEVKEKRQFACSASACTITPSSSTASRSKRRAWISPLATVV